MWKADVRRMRDDVEPFTTVVRGGVFHVERGEEWGVQVRQRDRAVLRGLVRGGVFHVERAWCRHAHARPREMRVVP